jgi:hypothetical protein
MLNGRRIILSRSSREHDGSHFPKIEAQLEGISGLTFVPASAQNCMQAVLDTLRELREGLVAVELDRTLGCIQHNAAAITPFQMRFQLAAQLLLEFSVYIEIQFFQNMLTVHNFRRFCTLQCS